MTVKGIGKRITVVMIPIGKVCNGNVGKRVKVTQITVARVTLLKVTLTVVTKLTVARPEGDAGRKGKMAARIINNGWVGVVSTYLQCKLSCIFICF